MTKKAITTDIQPVGPYSPAVQSGNLLFLSGQLGPEGDIATQTNGSLDNIEGLLKSAGATWDHVVRVEIFLQDLNDFQTVNELYGSRLPDGVKPARQTVQVARLPLDRLVEISCIAVL